MTPKQTTLLVACLLAFLTVASADQYTPLPFRYQGFGSVVGQGVVLEPFYDAMCDDSRDTDKVLQKVIADHNLGPSKGLFVRYHLQILPYHVSSYYAAKAIQIVATLKGAEQAYKALQLAWTNLENWATLTVANLTLPQITQEIIQTYAGTFGINVSTFQQIWDSPYIEASVKDIIQYANSRQIYGTPFFLVNGVVVNDNPQTEAEWVALFKQFGIL